MDWRNAVTAAGYPIAEFDLASYSVGDIVNTLTAGSLTISVGLEGGPGGSTASGAEICNYDWASLGGGGYGTIDGNTFLNGREVLNVVKYTHMTFSFSEAVFGFGAWLFDNSAGSSERFEMTVTELGGATFTSGELDSGNGTAYFVEGWLGATSTVGITDAKITVLDASGNPVSGKWFEVDHIQVAVPEPFSMAFLGSAFAGVVGYRLRKRRKEAKK